MPHLFRTVNFTFESLQVPFNDIYVIDIFQKFIMKSVPNPFQRQSPSCRLFSNSALQYTEAVNHEYSNQVKNAKNSGFRQAGQEMSENQLSFETIHHLGFYYNTLKKLMGGQKVGGGKR